jgi:hypothetical protein
VQSTPFQYLDRQRLTRHSTLGHAYTQLIASFSESAQDHVNLADGLDAQVVNTLKLVEKRHEDAKKKVRAPTATHFPYLTHDIPLSKSKHFKSFSLTGIVLMGIVSR